MYNLSKNAQVLTFSHFNRKGWSLFSCLHREVRIGVLGVATLMTATPRLMAAGQQVSLRPLSAETDDEVVADTFLLAQADVCASRAPLSTQASARQVTVFTRDELAAAGVRTVNDVLKLTAGVDVRQRGGFGIQTDISIEGGTHDQITILLNGVPLVNPQTGHNAADFPINLADIERIEILEGAASRVFGSQAFSGAVHIVTRHVDQSVPVDVRLEGGSYGTLRTEARTAWKLPKGWAFSASGSFNRSDGAVPHSDFKGGKGYAQLSYDSPDFELTAQGGVTANDFGANTFYSAAYPNQWESTRRYLVSARAETKGRVHLVPQVSWLRSLDHYQLVKNSPNGENFHRSEVWTAGLNAWVPWKAGRTAVGAEIREEEIFSTNLGRSLTPDRYVGIPQQPGRFYNHRDGRTNVSYFLEHNFVWRQMTLSLGVMAERNNAIDSKFRFYPGVDFSYRPCESLKLFVSYNKSLRLPSFTDLWYKSPTQEGNQGLLPEECHAVRLGMDGRHRVLSWKVKLHYQRGQHMIDWIMRNPDDKYHASSFSLDNYGAGTDVTLDLDEWWGKRQPFHTFSVSYAWIGQHRRSGEPYFKSNYAMEYLRHSFVARLRHRIVSRLEADWTLRVRQREGGYLEYQNLKATGRTIPYGHHALLDCRLSWKDRHYELFADFSNITDCHYYDLGNVPQAGFMAMGGVHILW